jgi:hypothetical protein
MSTRDDLYGAFALLEERAPTVCEVPMRAPSLTRRIALPAAAAATVTAVAVGVPVALRHEPAHRSSSPAASTAAPHRPVSQSAAFGSGIPAPVPGAATELRLAFTVNPVPGFTVRGDEVTRTYQHATINAQQGVVRADGSHGGELYVFYRNGYVPEDALGGRRVDVNGRPGYLGNAYPPYADGSHDDVAGDGHVPVNSIAWQYAPNSWALLTLDTVKGKSSSDADLLTLASALRPARQELTMPFRLTYLPAGLTADGAEHSDESLFPNEIGLRDDRAGAPGTETKLSPPGYDGPAMTVSVFKTVTSPDKPFPHCSVDAGAEPPNDQVVPFDVPGGGVGCTYYRHGAVTAISLRQGGNGSYAMTIAVDRDHYGRYSQAQLRKIIDGMRFALDIDDASTWFDATSALPH